LSTSLRNNGAFVLALAAAVLLTAGLGLALLWAPEDADQGPSQRIFYIHVPVALTAYLCFGWAAWKAFRLLWKRDERADLESYTAVHMGVIFGLLTLITGSISAYFMLRYSTEPGPRRARTSAVYALFGAVLLPVSFLAIRLAEQLLHPAPLFNRDGPQMSASMFITFCVCLAAMVTLAAALYLIELTGKRADATLRELRERLA
jgi:heme exporter protein C